MPAGCEFMCNNKECKDYKAGFNLNAPWPLGKIDDVLNSRRAKENEPFSQELVAAKNEGLELTSILFPNDDNTPIVGVRTQRFCTQCYCIGKFDTLAKENESIELIKSRSIEETKDALCPKCQSATYDFSTIIEMGIKCPSCGEKMLQNRWSSKEAKEAKDEKK